MTLTPKRIARADGIAILRRAGYPEETIHALGSQLDDPIDTERDAAMLDRYRVTVDLLIDQMGGSP